MKRKLTILGVCALVALGTILAFSNKKGRGTAGATQSLIITQDGKLAVQSQPNWRVTVVMDRSKTKTNTNASSSATNSGNK